MINLVNSSAEKIKIAVIGAGYLGRFHAQKYARSSQAELVAIIDTDIKRAKDVAEELVAAGLCSHKIIVSNQIKDCTDAVEAASIVVPTQAHYAVATACLNYGLHCLIEKPFTVNVAQADQLIAMAQQKKLKIQIGHLERFNPAFIQLKQELKHHNKPLFIETHRMAGFQPRATDVNVVFDLMIHDIDLVLHLANSNITHIEADGISVITKDVDLANARIRFASGSFANLTSSRISKESKRTIEIFTDKQHYVMDCKKQSLESNQITEQLNMVDMKQSYGMIQTDNLQTEIEHFLAAIKADKEPLVTAYDGRKALAIASEITEKIYHARTK